MINSPATNDPVSKRDSLTAREIEVLELAADGLTNREIAERTLITVHAVKFHLASIYRKLGVNNRTEAAVRMLRDSLAEPSRGAR
jgi:DNA-binding NarL/FixJ family response regulator